MQVAFTRSWPAAGRIRVYSMHPGWADTPGVAVLTRFSAADRPLLRTAEEGADTAVCSPRPGRRRQRAASGTIGATARSTICCRPYSDDVGSGCGAIAPRRSASTRSDLTVRQRVLVMGSRGVVAVRRVLAARYTCAVSLATVRQSKSRSDVPGGPGAPLRAAGRRAPCAPPRPIRPRRGAGRTPRPPVDHRFAQTADVRRHQRVPAAAASRAASPNGS